MYDGKHMARLLQSFRSMRKMLRWCGRDKFSEYSPCARVESKLQHVTQAIATNTSSHSFDTLLPGPLGCRAGKSAHWCPCQSSPHSAGVPGVRTQRAWPAPIVGHLSQSFALSCILPQQRVSTQLTERVAGHIQLSESGVPSQCILQHQRS